MRRGPSPDTLLLGLHLLAARALTPQELARDLRDLAAVDPPDGMVFLAARAIERRPALSGAVGRLSARPPYTLVRCVSCGGMFRARAGDLLPESHCRMCGEAIMPARAVLLEADVSTWRHRAAEVEPVYSTLRTLRLAHFELGDLLGGGGAGRVYRAVNRRTGRTVALKVLSFRPLESSSDSLARLQHEAYVASTIVHENLVPVYDMGVCEGLAYIEMELVRGLSLRETVRQDGALPPRKACDLCVQTLAGLAAMHRQGLTHGDIKPANILLDELGRARLTDFGLSRFLEETTSVTGSSTIVGSPQYMAPEQWRGEKLTEATDIYAVGLVLYFMLTGADPYAERAPDALMYKHLHEPVIEPGAGHPFVSDHLLQVILRATDKSPARRFTRTEEFAQGLRWFLDHLC